MYVGTSFTEGPVYRRVFTGNAVPKVQVQPQCEIQGIGSMSSIPIVGFPTKRPANAQATCAASCLRQPFHYKETPVIIATVICIF
jgi:hypothetical protein